VLLCLPGSRWILVDCHLTKFDGVYDRFFSFLESRNVKRLEYVILTHPDLDHFLGMSDVLRYFTSENRSVGCWCDSGPNIQQVREHLAPSSKRRYDELQRLLDELDKQGKIGFHAIDHNGCEIGPKGYENRVDLIPIAPDPGVLRRNFRRDIERLQSNPRSVPAANPQSVILVVCLQDNGHRFQLLLGADPDAEVLATALDVWEWRATSKNRPKVLDAVKVPHHGSLNSHYPQLCLMGTDDKGGRVAVVSAGMRPRLPERSVLADYLKNKWTLLITTSRGVRKGRALFSSLISGNRPSSFPLSCHDIQLTWRATEGLRWEPRDAQVTEPDLMNYQTSEPD